MKNGADDNITVSDAKKNFEKLVDNLKSKRVVLEKKGKAVGAIVSVEDLKVIEQVEKFVCKELTKEAIIDILGESANGNTHEAEE